MDVMRSSNWKVNIKDRITTLEFCPYNWCGSFIAIGTRNSICIGKCIFPEEEADVDALEFIGVRDFHHPCRVIAISWSPQTNVDLIPRLIKFCTAGSDHKIRLFVSDLRSEDTVQVFDAHKSYINDVAFEPEKGERIASVSDDNTCRVSDLNGNNRVSLMLKAPGISVRWHRNDPGKIMVAEKSGIIRFYNLITQSPIMSLDCGRQPLLMADWCLKNSIRVGCVAGSDWAVWDISRSSRPTESHTAHVDLAQCFRWCPTNDNLLATVGRPGNQIKVFLTKTAQVCLLAKLPVVGGISWHYKLPIIAVGSDENVHFWSVEQGL